MTEVRGPRPAHDARGARRADLRRLASVTCLMLAALVAAATTAQARPKPVRLTLTGPEGERTIDAADLRFVFFDTRYRRTRVPVDESPTRERVEILNDRDDCACLRLADYSRIRFAIIRAIEVRVSPGDRVARVQVVRRDGRTQEISATGLYGGDGLAPPLFIATIDGVAREFPLILPDTAGSAWPEEMLVRALLVPPPPAPAPSKKGSRSH